MLTWGSFCTKYRILYTSAEQYFFPQERDQKCFWVDATGNQRISFSPPNTSHQDRPYVGVLIGALLSNRSSRHRDIGLRLAKRAAELLATNTALFAKSVDAELLAETRDRNHVIDPTIWHHLYEGCRDGIFKNIDEGREKLAVSIKSANGFYRVARLNPFCYFL